MDMDVVLNKCAVIEKCIKRVIDEYSLDPVSLQNQTKQDAIILNLLRACEATIGLAMHIVAELSLSVPQSSRDSIEMLRTQAIISDKTAHAMKNMIGFRNIAVDDYQALNLDIVQTIIERHLTDFSTYSKEILEFTRRKL